jgi:hypothetical protein
MRAPFCLGRQRHVASCWNTTGSVRRVARSSNSRFFPSKIRVASFPIPPFLSRHFSRQFLGTPSKAGRGWSHLCLSCYSTVRECTPLIYFSKRQSAPFQYKHNTRVSIYFFSARIGWQAGRFSPPLLSPFRMSSLTTFNFNNKSNTTNFKYDVPLSLHFDLV